AARPGTAGPARARPGGRAAGPGRPVGGRTGRAAGRGPGAGHAGRPAGAPPAARGRHRHGRPDRRRPRRAAVGTHRRARHRPRRRVADLVLADAQFRQVREISAAFRAWPRVAETWGFGRGAGDRGVKVLFTGEPGTGKTLSAEILAGMLGLQLLKVDLSQVVS